MRKTRKAALVGSPVAHSKSPYIHEYWMRQNGIEGRYEAIETPPSLLFPTVKRLCDQEYAGFNVTVPHKKEIIRLCDHVDRTANAVGAVNTVQITNGALHGTNTDVEGFLENIRRNSPASFSFKKKPAVVLGAGGAAHAVVYGLKSQACPAVTVINRTPVHAKGLAEKFTVDTASFFDLPYLLKEAGLLINATSLGMEGMPPLEIDLTTLPQDALVCDLVYAPRQTPLLAEAARRGNPVVGGIGMLLYQAAPAFELWFGMRPKVTQALTDMISRP